MDADARGRREGIAVNNYRIQLAVVRGGRGRLGLRSDADVFAYYAETRFDTLCWYYARGFRHIIPALCRNFLKRRAWRDDNPKDEEYSEPVSLLFG